MVAYFEYLVGASYLLIVGGSIGFITLAKSGIFATNMEIDAPAMQRRWSTYWKMIIGGTLIQFFNWILLLQ